MRDFEYCQMTVACLRLSIMHGISMVSPKRTVYWGMSLFVVDVVEVESFINEYLPSSC